MNYQHEHKSVLLDESIENMCLKPGSAVIDATLGGGGHAREILKRILPGGHLFGFDKDADAIARCKDALSEFEQNVTFIHDDFKNAQAVLGELGIKQVNSVIADLGVSSFQLEDAERGFSYNADAKLDMRMDQNAFPSAYEVVNSYTTGALTRILRDYGEEKWAARIAQFIVEARTQKYIETTGELTEIIKRAIPAGARREGPHPAKRTFQALRIEVNGELKDLDRAVEQFAELLAPGGRLCVITFHSLEDRIVKQAMKKLYHPCECPPEAPICTCGKVRTVELITRKPIVASQEELEENPRARSAKLRVLEKI